jgi:hypothetical protein
MLADRHTLIGVMCDVGGTVTTPLKRLHCAEDELPLVRFLSRSRIWHTQEQFRDYGIVVARVQGRVRVPHDGA